jgi:hypothetical protein
MSTEQTRDTIALGTRFDKQGNEKKKKRKRKKPNENEKFPHAW